MVFVHKPISSDNEVGADRRAYHTSLRGSSLRGALTVCIAGGLFFWPKYCAISIGVAAATPWHDAKGAGASPPVGGKGLHPVTLVAVPGRSKVGCRGTKL